MPCAPFNTARFTWPWRPSSLSPLILGVLMLTDHKSGRGVIFIVAAVVATTVAIFARPRRSSR